MNCSNVQDEEQLRNVFSAFFPNTEFVTLNMYENHGVKVLEDGVFRNVSFRDLEMLTCDLETVETPSLPAYPHSQIFRFNSVTSRHSHLRDWQSLHREYIWMSSLTMSTTSRPARPRPSEFSVWVGTSLRTSRPMSSPSSQMLGSFISTTST